MPLDTSPEILGDNVSVKHNDILFELLLHSYNHNTSESTLWQAIGNSQVKFCFIHFRVYLFHYLKNGVLRIE